MDLCLSIEEARVLACLIEKERTTPEYYPMTINSLVAACNQKSNRDPVMELSEEAVLLALDSLRYAHRLASQVSLPGSRVMKYRHELCSRFDFDPLETAVLCELMLRGPQTAGELRARVRRMTDAESPAAVREALAALKQWGEIAFVAALQPRSGMREERYAHLLCGAPAVDSTAECAGAPVALITPTHDRVGTLEARVAEIEARLAGIEMDLRKASGVLTPLCASRRNPE